MKLEILTVLAQFDTNLPDVNADNLIPGIITFLSALAAALAVLFIVIGALKYSTSAGDPSKAATAKQTIFYAAVGLALVTLTYTVISFVIGAV